MICPIAEVKSGAEKFAPFNRDLILKSTDGHWWFTNVGHLLILKITVRRENQGEKRDRKPSVHVRLWIVRQQKTKNQNTGSAEFAQLVLSLSSGFPPGTLNP